MTRIMPSSAGEEATLKDLFIAISAVRNAYNLLVQELPTWLMKVVVFGERAMPCAAEVWTALGVEPHWVDELVQMKLHWSEGRLNVCSSFETCDNFTERLTGALLYLWKFVFFRSRGG